MVFVTLFAPFSSVECLNATRFPYSYLIQLFVIILRCFCEVTVERRRDQETDTVRYNQRRVKMIIMCTCWSQSCFKNRQFDIAFIVVDFFHSRDSGYKATRGAYSGHDTQSHYWKQEQFFLRKATNSRGDREVLVRYAMGSNLASCWSIVSSKRRGSVPI